MKQNTTKESILAYLKHLKPELTQNGINKVGLFGSYAKNKADEFSDIDIVIASSKKSQEMLVGLKFFAFMEDIREKVANKFNKSVDICDEIGLSPKDKVTILDGAIYV